MPQRFAIQGDRKISIAVTVAVEGVDARQETSREKSRKPIHLILPGLAEPAEDLHSSQRRCLHSVVVHSDRNPHCGPEAVLDPYYAEIIADGKERKRCASWLERRANLCHQVFD